MFYTFSPTLSQPAHSLLKATQKAKQKAHKFRSADRRYRSERRLTKPTLIMQANRATITFIFTGVDGEHIPLNATHVIIHDSVTAIPSRAFLGHPNIVEVILHEGVDRIERWAFYECPRLKRVIMPGVKIIEAFAFYMCKCVKL